MVSKFLQKSSIIYRPSTVHHLRSILLLFIIFIFLGSANAQITPLPHAHSHNDYERLKPLKDALANGFTSVEADVLYIYGKLYVGHNMPDNRRHNLKTLTRQYLKPLFKIFRKNGREIYKDYDGVFYLWIDIKFEPTKAYYALRERLYPFREMLNYYKKWQIPQR